MNAFLPMFLLLVITPLCVQLIYSIPLFSPKVSADSVLQFAGIVIGLALSASVTYLNKRSEELASREETIIDDCLTLLIELSSRPEIVMFKIETKTQLIAMSCRLKALDSQRAKQIYKAIKPFGQKMLDRIGAYEEDISLAYQKAYQTHPETDEEGETIDLYDSMNPDQDYSDSEEAIHSKYCEEIPAIRKEIDSLLKKLKDIV